MRSPDLTLIRRSGKLWRFAEGQYKISTMKLVDTLDEQRLLEELLDETKPPVPADCAGLHYLLFTPFRYVARHATRFRPAGDPQGVFYAAERVETAAAEIAFYRLLFYLESPALEPPRSAAEYSAFSVGYAADTLDLTDPPWQGDARLRDPVDYAPCHALARAARGAGAGAIRYTSIRDPRRRANVALLTCAAFSQRAPGAVQTWHFRIARDRVIAVGPTQALEFQAAGWDDPRLGRA